MAIIGIDSVTYGSPDLKAARKFFLDWGLKKLADSRSGMIFETGIGSQIIVRPEAGKSLRPRLEGGSNFREVIFGVVNASALKAVAEDLSRDRDVAVDADGTLHTIDDSGINVGFRVWRHRREARGFGRPSVPW